MPGVCPLFQTLQKSFRPYPPDPLPRRGRGRFLVLLCKGLRPLHPQACAGGCTAHRAACGAGRGSFPAVSANPCGLRYLPECRKRQSPSFQKSFSFLTGGAGSQGVRGTGGKDMLPGQASAQLFRPYPPDPLPRRGRGRFLVLLCKGLRPLHPQACAGGCTAHRAACGAGRGSFPAVSANPCGLRYLPECRKRQSPSFQKSFSFLTGGAGSQGVRGTGGEKLRRLRWSSPPGQGTSNHRQSRTSKDH